MASVPRTMAAGSMVGGRMPAGMRNVASTDRSALVESSASRTGIGFQDSAFLYQGYFGPKNFDDEEQQGNGQGYQRRPSTPLLGRLDATSQTFAAVMESQSLRTASLIGEDGLGSPRAFANLVAKAIDTYETNARVIRGEGSAVSRGGTLSISL